MSLGTGERLRFAGAGGGIVGTARGKSTKFVPFFTKSARQKEATFFPEKSAFFAKAACRRDCGPAKKIAARARRNGFYG
jgi:hypothetical protein